MQSTPTIGFNPYGDIDRYESYQSEGGSISGGWGFLIICIVYYFIFKD